MSQSTLPIDLPAPVVTPEIVPADSLPADSGTPSRRGRKPKGPSSTPSTRAINTAVNGIASRYVNVGQLLMMTVDEGSPRYVAGVQIIERADSCAKAWGELAKNNPTVARIMVASIGTSAWLELFAAHAPIVFAVYMASQSTVSEEPTVRDLGQVI